MKFVFRADASASLGSGHAMRCAAVAEEAKSRGIECLHLGSLGQIKWLEKYFELIDIPQLSNAALGRLDFSDSVLITDAYHLDPNQEVFNSLDWKLRVVIADDSTPKYRADLIIHPGLESNFESWNFARVLAGPAYIPFRKSIVKRGKISFPQSKAKVVIFGGGTDPFDFAGHFSKILKNFLEFSSAVVFTDSHFEIADERFKSKKFGVELDSEISSSDIVFATASTSSLEVIAREVPVGIACVIDNQEMNYETLGRLEVAARIGRRKPDGEWEFDLKSIHRLLNDSIFRNELVNASQKLIDLDGSKRIVDEIFLLTSKG